MSVAFAYKFLATEPQAGVFQYGVMDYEYNRDEDVYSTLESFAKAIVKKFLYLRDMPSDESIPYEFLPLDADEWSDLNRMVELFATQTPGLRIRTGDDPW